MKYRVQPGCKSMLHRNAYLADAQKEYLQDFLNDVENNKIHKP